MSEIGLPLSVGSRVVVTGMAGAGKSTFSRALSAKTGLPVICLDLHSWNPGWVRTPEDEFREKERALLAGEKWIVDGNVALDLRFERADTPRVPRHAVVDLRTARVRARASQTARFPAARRLR